MREHREREHGIAVAAGGGELVPVRGLLVVLRHAEAVGIELAEQRHRLRVVLLARRACGEREGGEEIAALKRAEGEIGPGAPAAGAGSAVSGAGWLGAGFGGARFWPVAWAAPPPEARARAARPPRARDQRASLIARPARRGFRRPLAIAAAAPCGSRPYPFTERDEIGAGLRQRRDLVAGLPA